MTDGIVNYQTMTYRKLEDRFKRIGALQHALAMLSWDEAVMMPEGGGARRGQSLAALAGSIHEQAAADEVQDLLAACAQDDSLDVWQRANVTQIERRSRRARALPNDLVMALTKATSACEQSWRELRVDNDWLGIQGALEEVVNLTKQKADCLGQALALSPYDALIDEFEPGVTQALIEPIFAELAAKLPPMIEAVIERQPKLLELGGPFADVAQERLAVELMSKIGFDFRRGRLDRSHHPFCGGDPDDVRITTRYNAEDFMECMFAVLHETGHAMYEQGLPIAWRDQPVGGSGGMALHESQSLFMEMQVSRGRAFLNFATPIIRRQLAGRDADLPEWSTENLHALATRVERGFIRVDADELTYPLHVILRYELEKSLLSGDLRLADVPGAWDERMRRYLSLSTAENHADGCMQDVHWFAGLVGYFPTYTLGAIAAAQLFRAAKDELHGLDEQFASGDFEPVVNWLREHVHSRGCVVDTATVVREATAAPLGTEAFLTHLELRYGI